MSPRIRPRAVSGGKNVVVEVSHEQHRLVRANQFLQGEYREYSVDASQYYADVPITGKRDDAIPGAPLQGIVVERRQADVDVAKKRSPRRRIDRP